MSISDHSSLLMIIYFDIVPNTVKGANNLNPDLVLWSSLSEDDIVSYFCYTDVLLSNLYLLKEANNCANFKKPLSWKCTITLCQL